jgi:hypothetical protein
MMSRIGVLLKQAFHALAGLKIAVVGLVLGFVLVLVGTLDQVNLGIYYTVKVYFKSWWVYWHGWPVFPGGMSVGLLLGVNLVLAHIKRFQWSMKKMGIWLIHSSLLVLLIGGAISGFVSQESQMIIREGDTQWYSESVHDTELVVMQAQGETTRVFQIDMANVQANDSIVMGPLVITVESRLNNAILRLIDDANRWQSAQGAGRYFSVEPRPVDRRPDARNHMALWVRIHTQDGTDLGRFLVSSWLNHPQWVGDRATIALRPTRYYYPYAVTLMEFTHRQHPGTTIPSYFSSDVIVTDGSFRQPFHIYMNHPLRYQGITYFQASFDDADTVSILQLVKNPVWWSPYFACLVLGVGLVWHMVLMMGRLR